LGLTLKAGDLEDLFIALRTALIKGEIGEGHLNALRDLFGKGLISIPFETVRAIQNCLMKNNPLREIDLEQMRDAIEQGMIDIPCKMLCSLLKQGISPDDPLRADILHFVSSVTKQYDILYAVLDKARFADLDHLKEFEIIYGNLAKQSSTSSEKRQKLANIRNRAVEILLAQNETACLKFKQERASLTREERDQRLARLNRLFQDNLMVVTRYKLSDYIVDVLLAELDFHPESSFRIFYQNIVLSEDDTTLERWRIVNWIEITRDKAFIRTTLSHVYRYEKSTEILDQLEAFLDQQKKEGGLGEIILRVPPSSWNYERYMTYKNKEREKVPTTSGGIENKNIDRKKCEAFKRRIGQEGIKKIVSDAFCDQRLIQLASEVIDAWTLRIISTEEAEEFKQRISNYDWKIASNIKPPSRGFSSADISRTEMTPEDVEKFNQQAREIADKLKKQ